MQLVWNIWRIKSGPRSVSRPTSGQRKVKERALLNQTTTQLILGFYPPTAFEPKGQLLPNLLQVHSTAISIVIIVEVKGNLIVRICALHFTFFLFYFLPKKQLKDNKRSRQNGIA